MRFLDLKASLMLGVELRSKRPSVSWYIRPLGIFAYLASMVDRISASPLDSETLKWLNLNRHIRNREISTLRLTECHSTQEPLSLDLRFLEKASWCWPNTTM